MWWVLMGVPKRQHWDQLGQKASWLAHQHWAQRFRYICSLPHGLSSLWGDRIPLTEHWLPSLAFQEGYLFPVARVASCHFGHFLCQKCNFSGRILYFLHQEDVTCPAWGSLPLALSPQMWPFESCWVWEKVWEVENSWVCVANQGRLQLRSVCGIKLSWLIVTRFKNGLRNKNCGCESKLLIPQVLAFNANCFNFCLRITNLNVLRDLPFEFPLLEMNPSPFWHFQPILWTDGHVHPLPPDRIP